MLLSIFASLIALALCPFRAPEVCERRCAQSRRIKRHRDPQLACACSVVMCRAESQWQRSLWHGSGAVQPDLHINRKAPRKPKDIV